jgi:hypothetical protein
MARQGRIIASPLNKKHGVQGKHKCRTHGHPYTLGRGGAGGVGRGAGGCGGRGWGAPPLPEKLTRNRMLDAEGSSTVMTMPVSRTLPPETHHGRATSNQHPHYSVLSGSSRRQLSSSQADVLLSCLLTVTVSRSVVTW